MSFKNLEERMKAAGGAIKLLRDSQTGPNPYPVVKPEYTNWRDEQWAWQNTAVLFNQSYHMTDLYVSGPDAFELLESLGINSFKGFVPGKAKQYVPVTWDGHVDRRRDPLLPREEPVQPDRPSAGRQLGAPTTRETGKNPDGKKWNVKLERDERSASRTNPTARKTYRYQVQGPNAMKVMTKVLGKAPPDLKFFNMADITIAGKKVHALRHGMAGQPGFELFGPAEDGEAVLDAIVEGGRGVRPAPGRWPRLLVEHAGVGLDSLPDGAGIYSGDERMTKYREWLPARMASKAMPRWVAATTSNNIDDHYVTPYDLGYGVHVKFDHDFIGREALEKIANKPHRIKVTLELNDEDVQQDHRLAVRQGRRARQVHRLPVGRLLDVSAGQGAVEGRQAGRRVDLGRLQLERAQAADARVPRCRVRRSRAPK